MSTRCWNDPELACSELTGGQWDWLIHSSRQVNEVRAQWATKAWPNERRISLDRADLRSAHRFKIGSDETDIEYVSWSELAPWLANKVKPGERVLLDMCLLGFDTVLYLLPALLHLHLARLGCLYVAPSSYTFPSDPLADLLLQSIEQPKAYVASLSHDKDKVSTKHLVFLGFDHARAWKFIDARGWKLQHLHAVLGDPPFVENGVRQAREAAAPWLPEFESIYPEQLHRIAADDPAATAQLCRKLFEQSDWLDIVPIGPKPMNLGVLWFYFSIGEQDRARVRLLYDFPSQQSPRSAGIGKVYVYDCGTLMNKEKPNE